MQPFRRSFLRTTTSAYNTPALLTSISTRASIRQASSLASSTYRPSSPKATTNPSPRNMSSSCTFFPSLPPVLPLLLSLTHHTDTLPPQPSPPASTSRTSTRSKPPPASPSPTTKRPSSAPSSTSSQGALRSRNSNFGPTMASLRTRSP